MNNDLLKMLFGSTIRHGLTALSAYLVAQHMLAPEHAGGFIDNSFTYLMDALPGLVAYGLSLTQKVDIHAVLNS